MNAEDTSQLLRKLPGVDILINHPELKQMAADFSHELVVFYTRQTIEEIRRNPEKGIPEENELADKIADKIRKITSKSLRPVINATGVIIHTNLGRAPFGEILVDEVREVLRGYNNLEFDLETASRGSRYTHVTGLLKFLTGAEDVLVVNNNAAAVILVLRSLAKNREVIISRGELIEIGGSFRLPDIMKASDCKMVEVGTTNKTRIADFEKAMTPKTAMLLKAHHSNYTIKGFTEEASLEEMVKLGKNRETLVVYDMGSGLLRKASIKMLEKEPDVKTTLATGIDLVTFSGDKLLGGSQAGIIAGKKELIAKLKKEPLTRALRVGKTTLALLEAICLAYLDESTLFRKSPVFRMMNADEASLEKKAGKFQQNFSKLNISTEIVKSEGQAGGGSLPEHRIPSFAVKIEIPAKSRKNRGEMAAKIFDQLLKKTYPVLGVLRKGDLIFDVLTIPEEDFEKTAHLISEVYKEVCHE
jgi:L-seryl-tRNA(Ser) seleniumtransferase